MARAPRVPKSAIVEPAPPEPDALANAPPPREQTRLFGHRAETVALATTVNTMPPQALLFTGPRGVGKATLAFRLARALVSQAAISDDLASDPASRDARQIAAGTHPNVLHLTRPYDHEKKRFKADLSVDTVRAIVPFAGSTAAAGGWRVVIVDAVDDMNLNAANALLKTLEEPPRRTLFVLIAHVSGRVLPTLRSRCRTVPLRPLAESEVAAALSSLGADPDLAAAGEGSVRRALKMAAAGADVVRSAQRLLRPAQVRDVAQRHALAELAAQRQDEQFAVILDIVLDALGARVREGAGRLPLAALNAYASAYLEATDQRRRVEVFNLDRKEAILWLTTRLAVADRLALGSRTA